MRLRLSNLLLLMACAAMAFGWYADHRQLVEYNERLNAECVEFFRQSPEVYDASDTSWLSGMSSRPSRKMFYDANDPEDRARYKQGRPSKVFGTSGLE